MTVFAFVYSSSCYTNWHLFLRSFGSVQSPACLVLHKHAQIYRTLLIESEDHYLRNIHGANCTRKIRSFLLRFFFF